ncbi:hypothetical protein D7X33_14185 [Butyricicoccus sp. 1XD8-22]|nr:hypothetical protein D7X33_14185 [Butyricicoccus sp. 1XD8-22]
MIAYFPDIYPDELIYSQLLRYYINSGYNAYVHAAEELFGSHFILPNVEFLNFFTPNALQMITRKMPIEDIILNHTMFPYYGRFLLPERKRKVFCSLCSKERGHFTPLQTPHQMDGVVRYLRYCPMCAARDRERYGETFWHRAHQIPNISSCPFHGCYLLNSSAPITKSRFSIENAAEVIIPFSDTPKMALDIEQQLSAYMWEVFQSDMNMNSNVIIGRFLHSRIENTKYCSARGAQRNITALYNDFIVFYDRLPDAHLPNFNLFQIVFRNYKASFYRICLLSMFLGISPHDLSNMILPQMSQAELFDKKVRDLRAQRVTYHEISKQLNVSRATAISSMKNNPYRFP